MRELQFTNGGALAAAVVAVVASSCCALPMALVFAGVSTSAVSFLGPLHAAQPFILGLAALLLATGWVLTFRARARAMAANNCPRGRFRSNFIVLASASALLVVAMTWQSWDLIIQHLVMQAAQR